MKLGKYNIRRKIFYRKKKLKSKKNHITERLTKRKVETLKKTQQEFRFHNAWLSDGRKMYKDRSNEVTVFYD